MHFILRDITLTILYQATDDPVFDEFMYMSSFILRIISLFAISILIIVDKPLREHKTLDKFYIFCECLLVISQNVMELLLIAIVNAGVEWANVMFYVMLTMIEALYMLNILQWMICVDYCLYRSRDHIKRRYKYFWIPVLVVGLLDFAQSMLIYNNVGWDVLGGYLTLIMEVIKHIIEICYVLYAVHIVRKYDRESREPIFISLRAFIIPFVIGCLIRYYDAPLLAFGIIITYVFIKRRDKYLDPQTGFYNKAYLEFHGNYRDRANRKVRNGLLIDAKGHGEDMASILKEFMPADANVFVLGKDLYLMMSDSLRGSAVKMAVNTITEMAETADDPYTPVITTALRGEKEPISQFAERISRQ